MAAPADTKTLVVVAVDASKQSLDSFNYYFENVHHQSHRILLLHIIELPDMSHARQAHITPSALYDLWMEENAKSKELEAKYAEIVKQKGIKDVSFRMANGMKPGEVIVDIAIEEKAALIVMGTRGMGLIRRTILGSHSDYVVHHAPCAVLVCRKREDNKDDNGKHHRSSAASSDKSSDNILDDLVKLAD